MEHTGCSDDRGSRNTWTGLVPLQCISTFPQIYGQEALCSYLQYKWVCIPFILTMKQHESIKGTSEWSLNVKNKLAKFSFILFISILLPFYEKRGIFSSSSVAILISLSSVFQNIPIYLELLFYTFRFLTLVGFWGSGWLFIFNLQVVHVYSWHFS